MHWKFRVELIAEHDLKFLWITICREDIGQEHAFTVAFTAVYLKSSAILCLQIGR